MRRAKSTRKEQPGLSALREIAESFELSGDAVDDARRLNAQLLAATGGIDGYSLLPSQVRLPFDIPSPLRFAVPDAVPIDRQKKAVSRRLVADLRATNPNVRRAAAFDLGGWSPAPEVDRELIECLARESDLYVRSVVALSIALRNMTHDVDLIGVSQSIVEAAVRPHESSLESLAGSIALLAATIAVTRSTSPRCHDVVVMAQSLALIESERARAEALLAIVSEHC
jgi:hypothetical protein